MSEKNEDKVYFDLKRVPLQTEIQEKKKKKKFILINFSIFMFLIVLGFVLGILFNQTLHPANSVDETNTFGEIEAVLEKNYLYKDDYEDMSTQLLDKAFYGMTSFDDDPYTTYLSRKELEEFAQSINLDYVGIGIIYTLHDGYGIVERVLIDSPAEEAGMLVGDILTAIDGVSIDGLTTLQIKEMVTGEVGTIVTISITRDNESFDLDVVRGNVDNSVYAYSYEDFVVLNIYSFGETTGSECISYLDDFTDYSKIIIDIRDNSGGYQTAVAEIAGLFIGNNEVYLRQVDSNGEESAALTNCSKTYNNFDKIVVLINENTASAAEVFALCLREKLDNVTLVGTTTYGKGVIQSTHYLANGGALKFTSYKWLSPNGVSIHEVGVEPDVEVKLDDICYSYYVDMQDDEIYEYDSVSEANKTAQLCLSYLGYEVDRKDGYFDESFKNALNEFKLDGDLVVNDSLDKQTYDALVLNTMSAIYSGHNDYQMEKAIEIISE